MKKHRGKKKQQGDLTVGQLIEKLKKWDAGLFVHTHRDEERCECCGSERVYSPARGVTSIRIYRHERYGTLEQFYPGIADARETSVAVVLE